MSKSITFDANKRAAERIGDIVIGDRTFRARKRTSRVMERWIRTTATPPAEGTELGDDEERERSIANLHNLNEQLAVLLVDSEGKPSWDNDSEREELVSFLNDELDIDDAMELIRLLSPGGTDEEQQARD